MRDVPATISSAWREGRFIGDQRAIVRATIQHPQMKLRHFALHSTFRYANASTIKDVGINTYIDPSHGQRVNQTYADFMFSRLAKPLEIPNIQAVEWSRSIDGDVGSCTLTLTNSKPLDVGETPRAGELDVPGYYTPTRGATKFSRSRWKQTRNAWFGMLMPDNIIRTYEGYGHDPTVSPELDPYLVQTGVWIINDVTIGADGTMSIACSDIGRILMDQLFYPPLVPQQFFDNDWQNWSGTFPTTEQAKVKLTPDDSSNTPWVGRNGTVSGHKLSYAFDGNPNTYWLSIGNVAPSRRFAYEWVQAKVGNQSVSSVEVRTKKKGYVAYISVMVGGVWQGTQTINYHEDGIGKNGGDITYVAMTQITTEGKVTIDLPQTYAKVQKIRVTLGNLQDFKFGTYHYRGGIRDVAARGTITIQQKLRRGPTGSNPGRYYDYTDLVKLFCAWGGFFWPKGGQQRISNPPGTDPRAVIPGFDDLKTVSPARTDKVLGKVVNGRVWGDFLNTGTAGPVALDTATNFDKKSLMDCIAYIRDLLGFIFFIDELGGCQWRLPNMTNKGCYVSTLSTNPGYRKGVIHFVADTGNIMSLSSAISSANVREAFFVGDVAGKISAFAPGYNPNPTGLRRFGGWSDVNFAPETDMSGKSSKAQVAAAQAQVDLMAEMLSLRQLFTYRVNKLRIPANPAIQIDDQIRIAERYSSEGYIHYVRGIQSSLNMETGEWTYDIDTHWLGFDPASEWLFKTKDLTTGSQRYLAALQEAQLRMDNNSRIGE